LLSHTPLPTQAPAGLVSCRPAAMLAHAPTLPGRLHAVHGPAQALLQQTPSTQSPLAHSVAFAHPCPSALLVQWPLPSHTPLPSQAPAGLLSGWPAAMGVQVPARPGRSHARHGALQGLLQQTPSAQNPLAQSAPVAQGTGVLQVPLPVQALLPAQMPAG
jgi:hypothetical protein